MNLFCQNIAQDKDKTRNSKPEQCPLYEILEQEKTSYRFFARYYHTCTSFAAKIEDFGSVKNDMV